MLSRNVLSLTKPKGKIYKTKSLGHYITQAVLINLGRVTNLGEEKHWIQIPGQNGWSQRGKKSPTKLHFEQIFHYRMIDHLINWLIYFNGMLTTLVLSHKNFGNCIYRRCIFTFFERFLHMVIWYQVFLHKNILNPHPSINDVLLQR